MGCIDRGLRFEGELPGGLRVRRRAKMLLARFEADRRNNARPPHEIMDRLSLFAIAVNEENAAGGRVVTAPTNGAAGVAPSVLRYTAIIVPARRRRGCALPADGDRGRRAVQDERVDLGAEVGCQGEVGVACSMAAAGLAAALGGTNEQIENAAEIGMEHHLGMTCDPIGGLVQIPCIERNAFGAVKASTRRRSRSMANRRSIWRLARSRGEQYAERSTGHNNRYVLLVTSHLCPRWPITIPSRTSWPS